MQLSFPLVQQKKCFSSGTVTIPFRTAIKHYSILLSCLERTLKEKWQTIGALLKKCLQTTNMQSLSTWFKSRRSVLAKEKFFSIQSKFALVKITLHIRFPFHKTPEKGQMWSNVIIAKLNFVINVSLTSTSKHWTENTRYWLFVKLDTLSSVFDDICFKMTETSCTKYVRKMQERGRQGADALSRGLSLVSDM